MGVIELNGNLSSTAYTYHINFLDSTPTILDKSPQDSHALFIISGFAHNVHFENVHFVWALS